MSHNVLSYHEHYHGVIKETLSLRKELYSISFTKTHRGQDTSQPCFRLQRSNEQYQLSTSYFIGLDWVEPDTLALQVAPKLNKGGQELEIDYISMLFSALRHPEVSKEVSELFEVKWEQPTIAIEQKQDLLTPLLVVEFLSLLKIIVRKGLKKSYYRVEQNLRGKVKGKIQVGKSIKHNQLKNKKLYTYCNYDVFGVNHKENRLLKKALTFVKRYLPTYPQLKQYQSLQDTFNYINPAFSKVSDAIDLNEIKQTKASAFYKEYEPAIKLAKLILKRFGYNISNTAKTTIATPPFWIDMSKLFELYVLGLLKDRFGKQVQFQYKYFGNELDYLLNSQPYKMVIDAKYKPKYISKIDEADMRQISGYARLRNVYKALKMEQGQIIDCLIIYPDTENGVDNLKEIDLKSTEIERYFDIYKLGVKLPLIN